MPSKRQRPPPERRPRQAGGIPGLGIAVWRDLDPVLRAALIYGVSLGALLYCYAKLYRTAALNGFLELNARATGWLLTPFVSSVHVQSNVVQSNTYSIGIVEECTALAPLAVFIAGVLAVPASAKSKLWGVVMGLVVLSLVNVVRMASLFFVGSRYPWAMDVAHLIVWQALMVLLAVLLWLFWMYRWARRAPA